MDYVWCLAANSYRDSYETYMVFSTFEKAMEQFIDDAINPLTLAEAIHDMMTTGAKFKLVDKDDNELDYTTYDPQTMVFSWYATGTFATGTTEVYRILTTEMEEYSHYYDKDDYETLSLNGYKLIKMPLN